MREGLTYKDFKIGQVVMCKSVINDTDFNFWLENEHLIPGESYIIDDLEWRYHDKICIKSSYSKQGMFAPIKFFDSTAVIRDNKLSEILK